MKISFWAMPLLLIGAVAPPCHSQSKNLFIPDYITIQYAGSTGWMSVGAGYNLFKQRARVEVRYGYIPEEKGGKLQILSSSFFFKPFAFRPSDRFSFNPLDAGIKVGYHFGNQFYLNWPSRFPDGYYWWKSALRLHLATESSVTFNLNNAGTAKSVTAYLELNSSDLYLISYVLNVKSLSLTDIVKAGIGVRVGF